jgi:hypothetical protein
MMLNKPVPLDPNLSLPKLRREIKNTRAYLAAVEQRSGWATKRGVARAVDYLKRLELQAEGRG